jgi:hypothetical protein
MSKTFCPLPWNHLATHPHGSVTLCCEAEMSNRRGESFDRNDPESTRADKRGFLTFQRTNYDFKRIINGDSFNEVRLDLLNDRIPQPCSKCFEYESAGVESKRQREINRLDLSYEDAKKSTNADGTIDKVEYEFIELRLGNHCNLACRSCNPASSTRWIDDWEEFFGYSWKMGKELFEWPLDTNFWENLAEASTDKLRQLYINGGEPLLIDKHANYLRYLVENDYAKNINLYYSTNCTVKNKIYLDYWPHFKQVEFLASIDDIEHRNQYIRYPADWNKILQTYRWFMDLRNKYDNIKLSIMQTVSIYNIFYLNEFVEYMKNVDEYVYIHYNFVYAPEYFNAAHLPYELKHIITNKLSSSNNVQVVKSLLQQEGDNKHFKNFLHKTATLDRIRNEKFEEVFPEFYYYLKAYKLV